MEAEIFVVDNNSTDGARDYLSEKFSSVIFTWNNHNEGFGKACNSILKKTSGNYILFLNPDTIVAEDCFEKCISFMQAHNDCGALGVRMIDGTGKFLKESKRSFPRPFTSLYKMMGLSALFPQSKLFARYYAGHLPENENNAVEVLSGAFMLLSKKAIRITGGFDEDFFMYGEDIDLSYRIQKAGLQNWYFAGTSILHFKGESTKKLSSDYIKHFYGAMKIFAKKHFSHNKKTFFLLCAAITVAKGLAGVKMKWSSKKAAQLLQDKPLLTAIAAGQQEFNECLLIIKHAKPAVVLYGRIGISQNDTISVLGNISFANRLVKENKIDQLVFCEGDLSFKSIIETMQKIPWNIIMLIHAANSHSMAGSNNKNTKGIFIAKP